MPQLLAALVAILLGAIIGWALGVAAKRLVAFTGVDEAVRRSGLNERLRFDTNSRYSLLSNMVGTIVTWIIAAAAVGFACDILGLTQVSTFIGAILAYIPNVIVAVVILTIGILASRFVSDLIITGLDASRIIIGDERIIAAIARYAIIVFAVMAALTQLQIVPQLIEIAFAGLVFALALAFGLGARDHARDMISSLRRETVQSR